MRVLSCVRLLVTPWTIAHQALLSMGLFEQEYWSGLPFLPLGDLPDPGVEPASPALAGGFFTTSATWEALLRVKSKKSKAWNDSAVEARIAHDERISVRIKVSGQ